MRLPPASAGAGIIRACNVAVNISPLVLANPALPEEIEALLLQYGLAPAALIAEITESTVIANPLLAAEVLTRLRIKGIGLSMDDFGTGYSSLLTLLRLPFTELKIDRSFIASAKPMTRRGRSCAPQSRWRANWGCRWSPKEWRPKRWLPGCATPAASLARAGTSAAP